MKNVKWISNAEEQAHEWLSRNYDSYKCNFTDRGTRHVYQHYTVWRNKRAQGIIIVYVMFNSRILGVKVSQVEFLPFEFSNDNFEDVGQRLVSEAKQIINSNK